MTDLTSEYLRWVINAALETTSLILWWQGSVTQVQPVLFPDTPFRWLDADEPIGEVPRGRTVH